MFFVDKHIVYEEVFFVYKYITGLIHFLFPVPNSHPVISDYLTWVRFHLWLNLRRIQQNA